MSTASSGEKFADLPVQALTRTSWCSPESRALASLRRRPYSRDEVIDNHFWLR
jgi:hypothetical protein